MRPFVTVPSLASSSALALLLAFVSLPAAGCAKDEPAGALPPSTPTTTANLSPSAAEANPSAAADAGSSAAPAVASTPMVAPTEVTVGQPAPDFTTRDQDGKPLHLADLKGKPVVVYFYPKDETPGCTKEACAFRDAWNDLKKKGVTIIGVSTDSDESHKAFIAHHKLPFTLVSDPKGEIAAKYGVPVSGGYVARQSFVIGADGNVKKVYRKVDVSAHAGEIASDLQ